MKKKINLKKMLATISLVTLVIPSSLTVVACKEKQTEQKAEKDYSGLVVDAISAINYKKDFVWNTKVEVLEKEINADFVFEGLSSEIKKVFVKSLFSVKQITDEAGRKISDSDLKPGVFKVNIVYDYANFKNEIAKLEINIVIVNQQIVDAISVGEYQREIVKNMKVIDLINLITPEYITHDWLERYNWSEDIIENIIYYQLYHLFRVNKIMKANSVELSDDDLKTKKTIIAEFNYDYGPIKNQNAKLIIKVIDWWSPRN